MNSECVNPKPQFLHISLLLMMILAAAVPGQAALISYWNLDEGSDMVANDTSGNPNNHNGALATGSETPLWTAGRLGGGLDFNQGAGGIGTGMRVVVPNHAELLQNGAFTITCWFRPDYVAANSTWPGIIRIGSQSATTGTTIGWGIYRAGSDQKLYYKRGNVSKVLGAALNVGTWYHVAMRYDGAGNNIAYINGVATSFAQTWMTTTATTSLEIGRMDAFENAGLDDLALFNEAVDGAKIRSLYTVPTSLALDYNLKDMRDLWAIFDGGPGSANVVKDSTWSYASSLPGSTTLGDAYVSSGRLYVVLGTGTGVSAPIRLITGTLSPGGVGTPASLTLSEPPITCTNATLVFDLGADTSVGAGINDLLEIQGDLIVNNSSISINPLSPLTPGTYTLITYTGNKTGTFNPDVIHASRYQIILDESTAGQVNVVVSGNNANLKWNSTSSGAWDLTTSNWLNLASSHADRFFQGDSITFDDSGAFQANITLNTAVYLASMAVNSSTLAYNITGSGSVGGNMGLTKDGTNALTLGTANSFFGTINLNAGLLKGPNATAFGAQTGGINIAEGATLDIAGFNIGAKRVTVQGAGFDGKGAIINSGAAIYNYGLRGGSLTLLGDTTIGGPNRWDIFGETMTGNGFKLIKAGPPEICLANIPDLGVGDIDILQGQLTFQSTVNMGDPTRTLTVSPNAILAFWGTGPVLFNKVIVMNSAILRNATSGGTDISTNLGSITLNGTNTCDGISSIALLGEISGTGSLTKASTGTLFLGGTNTYQGRTTITGGKVVLLPTGSTAQTSPIELQTGTTLDVSALAAPFTLSSGQALIGTGTIAGSLADSPNSFINPGKENAFATLNVTNDLNLNGGNLLFDLSGATNVDGGNNDLINVGGNLTLSGVTTIRVNPMGLLDPVNPYTLITYAGSLSGTAENFVVAGDSRYVFSVNLDTPGKVLLSVSSGAPEELIWFGDTEGSENIWDLRTTPNWGSSIGSEVFFNGDRVKFDDFSITNVINLVGSLNPASIVVENETLDYTFIGTGKISGGGSLTKTNAAALTIANSGMNDNIGPTDVQGGTLQIGDGGTVGNLGPGPITNNAIIILNRSDNFSFPNTLIGTSGSVVKANTNLLTLPTANLAYDGAFTVAAGILKPANGAALGSGVGGTVVQPGATLELNGLALTNEPITLAGAGVGGLGAVVNNGGGQNNATRIVTLTDNATVGGSARWDIRNFGGPASLSTGGNDYNLTKVGPNQFSLVDVAVDSALGDVDVQAGLFSVEFGTTLGDPARTLNIAYGATLQFYSLNNPLNKNIVLNGGTNIINYYSTALVTNTVNGPVTLHGDNVFNFLSTGTNLVFNNTLSGDGSLRRIGGSTTVNKLTLAADNTYTGGTFLDAGTLELGVGGPSGSVVGPIVANGELSIYRSDAYILTNNITGGGSLSVRDTNGLILDGSAILNIATLNIGQNSYGKLLIQPGATPTIGTIYVGNPGNVSGDIIQLGGTVTVTNHMRVGHWPNETSSYLLGGGSFTITGIPSGVVNPAGQPEQSGILYLGIDGIGIFIQTNGTASAHGIVMDGRGASAGNDTFSLEGGRFVIGPSGIKSGSLDANTTYQINLGGGVLASSANWTSVLAFTLTGTNGDVTIDVGSNTNTLRGMITGPGGLIKAGLGTLVLSATNMTYAGATRVSEGTLLVNGALGSGANTVIVSSGTVGGNGTINDDLIVEMNGVLAPGTSIGTLTVNGAITLDGATRMEINKAETTLTSDRLVGNSSLALGGTLTVVATGDPLALNDTFNLFDATSFSRSFNGVELPPLPLPLIWDVSMLAVHGTIRVIEQPRPQLTFRISAGSIELSWPDGYSNYILQAQTNAPGVGISTNATDWYTLDITTNWVSFPVLTDENIGSVYYRLNRQ